MMCEPYNAMSSERAAELLADIIRKHMGLIVGAWTLQVMIELEWKQIASLAHVIHDNASAKRKAKARSAARARVQEAIDILQCNGETNGAFTLSRLRQVAKSLDEGKDDCAKAC